MNQYNSTLRNACALADRILQLKGNRHLDSVHTLRLDDRSYVPHVKGWNQLQGYRMADPQALKDAAKQWIRASHRSGSSAVFLLTCDPRNGLSVRYSGIEAADILRTRLSDCHTLQVNWTPEGYRYTGILLGTFDSDGGVADTFASADLTAAYVACIVTPIADAMAQDMIAENLRLSAKLTPYQSFQRVYGNASRRTVDVPVQNVKEALAVLKDENEFLKIHLSGGLVCSAVRFGANDRGEFLRLANLLQASMTSKGEHPGFEPIRCFELQEAFDQASCLAIPRIPMNAVRDAYAVSLQGAADSASLCAAPTHSCVGFYVDTPQLSADAYDLFPAVRPITGEGLALGKALNSTGSAVLPLSSLLCHTAVFGGTCTGKTNAVMNILHSAWADHGIPFVVLEAAKKEYHTMLADIPELRVYTTSVDGLPLRMNPLQPEDGVLIENHISAVVRAIAAATGAEHPIPEAFQGLLKRTYLRFGWEYGTLAYTDHKKPFPTFGDVLKDIDDYIAASAQYGPEVRQNLTAALKLRCETFSAGALGRVFSVPAGMTARDLLAAPAVIELADLAEDSASFLMNILLFKLQSYLERLPTTQKLQRLIVVEEAHNVFRKTLSEESSLARSNQAFDKLFAEIRASGTGLILSDQRPSIMPDSVLANTALKLCFAMGSEDDRRSIGDAMGLSDIQRRELLLFGLGEGILSVRGHRGVFHVQTDKMQQSASFSAACMVCSSRFRCRKAAVQKLIEDRPAELTVYYLSKVRSNPYNTVVLNETIQQMMKALDIDGAASTRLCLLGQLLLQADTSLAESRIIVTAYSNYLKGGHI